MSRFMPTTSHRNISARSRTADCRSAAQPSFSVKLHATSEASELSALRLWNLRDQERAHAGCGRQTAHLFGTSGAACSVQNGLARGDHCRARALCDPRCDDDGRPHARSRHAGFEFYSNLWIGPFERVGRRLNACNIRRPAESLGPASRPLQDARVHNGPS